MQKKQQKIRRKTTNLEKKKLKCKTKQKRRDLKEPKIEGKEHNIHVWQMRTS